MSAMTIPRGLAGVPHHLAALALFLAGVEASTGALLSAHYVPTHAEAHGSVLRLVASVPFGELLRAVHVRGADLLVATVWLAVLASALDGGWRRPRAASWSALVLLGFVTLYAGFTGSLLPWSRDSAAGAQVATATVGAVPWLGAWLRRAMLGGDDTGAVTLVRVWGAHAALLPGVASAMLMGAAAQRVARPASPEDDTPSMPLAPHFLLRVAAMGTATMMALVLLAVFATPGVGAAAESAVRGGAAPWYLGGVHALLRAMPSRVIGVPGATVAVLLGVTAGAGLVALPWIDPRASRPLRGLVLALALVVLGGTVYARFA